MLTSCQRENVEANEQFQYENWSCSPKAIEKEKERWSPRNNTFTFKEKKNEVKRTLTKGFSSEW